MRKGNQILLFTFILLQCHIGHAIKCNSCIGECTRTEYIDCAPDQDRCVTKESNSGGNVQKQLGCGKSQECNASGSDASLTIKCCNTDYCNVLNTSATGGASSGPAGGGKPSDSPLLCFHCDSMICINKDTITCKVGDLCVTRNFTYLGAPMKKYGCANASDCSKKTTDTYMGSSISVDNKCCNEDLCNHAVGLKLPFLTAIGTVLLLWITKLC